MHNSETATKTRWDGPVRDPDLGCSSHRDAYWYLLTRVPDRYFPPPCYRGAPRASSSDTRDSPSAIPNATHVGTVARHAMDGTKPPHTHPHVTHDGRRDGLPLIRTDVAVSLNGHTRGLSDGTRIRDLSTHAAQRNR